MPFHFNLLPTELRLAIWEFAVRAGPHPRRVIEQNLQVFPTLNLAASPLFSVNSESREVAQSFYPVRLEVYRLNPYESEPAQAGDESNDDNGGGDARRGFVYLSPACDVMVSVYGRAAAAHESELSLERSERSRLTAQLHRTRRMSEATRARFHRHPDRWCLTRYASATHLGVHDWAEVHEWIRAFDDEEYRGARRLLLSMRINTAAFAQVFGWE